MCDVQDRNKTFAEIIAEYGLTEEQVAFYQQYSMERACYRYERNAAEKIGSSELVKDWKYCGYYDSASYTKEKCSNGHSLRYVHIALNTKTGEKVKFGIKCVSDFFSITPIQLKFIKQGFNEANKEILNALDKYVKWQGNWDLYESQFGYAKKTKEIIEEEPSLLKFSDDNFENLLKIGELQQILSLKLFLPDYFESMIYSAYNTLTMNKLRDNLLLKDRKEVLEYLKDNHFSAYLKAISINRVQHPSMAQQFALNKLISTPWRAIDQLVKDVIDKKRIVQPSFTKIYDSLMEQYERYGLTDKQYRLLNTCLQTAKN